MLIKDSFMLILTLRSKLKGICLKLHSSNVTDARYIYVWSLLSKPLPPMSISNSS